MTAMATDLEAVIFEALAHEFEVPCELLGWGKSECDRAARWVLHRSCCGTHSLGCDDCKEARVLNRMAVECPVCLHFFFDSSSAYHYIEPLNKRPS